MEEAAEKEINKILLRDPKTKVSGAVDAEGHPKVDAENKFNAKPTLADHEMERIAALSRKITKLPFDVGIRALYIAKKENFDTPFGIGSLISFFKTFNTENLNGFKPNGDRWTPWLDAPWKDFHDIRRDKFSREGILAFKLRSFFFPPFARKPLVLNTEELATIYHFPGSVSATPGLERVPSKKGEAPANLPI
jgi:hypothetical protein